MYKGQSSGVHIFAQEIPNSPLRAMKGVGVINTTPEEIVMVTGDLDQKPKFDPMFKMGRVAVQYGVDASLAIENFSGVWPVAGREMCYVRARVRLTNGVVVAWGTSVEPPDIPTTKGYVRADMVYGGFVLRPIEGGKTLATYSVLVDLKGNIPGKMLQAVSQRQPLVIARLRDFLAKR
mmetsp:Transcript_9282/g.21533  ORF Transcript_9282/g.21533 Transcript_9282/m.21533 type:complete len:178 (-) Transcript_9282:22-555(-)